MHQFQYLASLSGKSNKFDYTPEGEHTTFKNLNNFGIKDQFGINYDSIYAPPDGQELTPPEDHNPPHLMYQKPDPPNDTEAWF